MQLLVTSTFLVFRTSALIDSSSSSSSSDEEGSAPDLSGLSAETLAALQWHFAGSPPSNLESDCDVIDEASTVATAAAAAAAGTKRANAVNATMERLKAADAIREAHHQGNVHAELNAYLKTTLTARTSALQGSPDAIAQARYDLLHEGVVRLNGCLPPELCNAVLSDINLQMAALEPGQCGKRSREEGFGGVLARKCRYDAYQRPVGSFQNALIHLLGIDTSTDKGKDRDQDKDQGKDATLSEEKVGIDSSDYTNKANTSQVRKLLEVLFEGIDGAEFTELSVLISDPGAPRQQLHPDNAYQEVCPLYTVFIALQDITVDMGPTVFLPRTNTQQCHEDFNHDSKQFLKNDQNKKEKATAEGEGTTKENGWFLNSREWTTSLLKQGDVQILDSMTLHAATANVSKARRALLYFTFRNPKCLTYGMEGTPTITKGSLHDDVKLCFADYNPRRGGDV
jgi:hypothetical protein